MDGWLKGLIAAACVVAIAAGGYYIWGQYQSRSAANARAENINAARNELFRLSGAEKGDDSAVRRFCSGLDSRIKTDLKDNDMAPGILRNCRALGYI